MVTDPCQTPTVTCNRWDLQSPAMQKWLLIQALNYINSVLGGTLYTADQLEAGAEGWVCQGSPNKIDEQIAMGIVSNVPAINTSQPVCWTPLQIEGALAFILCKVLSSALGPR